MRWKIFRSVLPGLLMIANVGTALVLKCTNARAGLQNEPADRWVTNAYRYPGSVTNLVVATKEFNALRAEVIAGLLKVYWTPDPSQSNGVVTIFASADEPGHWPVRDWHADPMRKRGDSWETSLPVESLEVPVVYFVEATTKLSTNVSPMRICWPRRLGLEEPTQMAWNFVEGFEEGSTGWSIITGGDSTLLQTDSLARSGRSALLVRLPPGKRSVTVGTTRLRGWRILENRAMGLRLWARTRQGDGSARFTLHANAFTPDQVVSSSATTARLNEEWQRIDLPFDAFPRLPLAEIDWFTIEFVADGPRDFLIDDVEYLGSSGVGVR